MQARIIHTRFWTDAYISRLTPKQKLLFMYFLSNEHVNLVGVYELPMVYLTAATGLNQKEIDSYKSKFEADRKFRFYQDWIRIVNYEKYQSYKGSKNEEARARQLSAIPSDILEEINSVSTKEDSVSVKSDTPSNQKSIINNQKSITNTYDVEGKEFLKSWNEHFATSYTSLKAISGNLTFWRENYSLEQICDAIGKIKNNDFWRDKMSPVTFLRRKNPRGEPVDYIGEMLNAKPREVNKILTKII